MSFFGVRQFEPIGFLRLLGWRWFEGKPDQELGIRSNSETAKKQRVFNHNGEQYNLHLEPIRLLSRFLLEI
jgi:hypothetical protein